MRQHSRSIRILLGVGTLITFGWGSVVHAVGNDSAKTTGTGTVQGEDGSMSTQSGGNSVPTTGRNADSGSATGKIRDPKQSEPDSNNAESSQHGKPASSHPSKHPGASGKDKKKDAQGH